MERADGRRVRYQPGYRYKILDGKLIDADRCQATTIGRTGEQRGRWPSDR